MSKISIYDVVPVPKLADKLIGTSVGGDPEDLTYNFTLGELLNLFIPNIPGNTLQGVLDFGNTATQDINLTGTINTTDLNVGGTLTILDSDFTGETHILGGLYDSLNSIGTPGQVLISTGTQVEWYTIPTVIPNLQQVLTSGNTAVNNIILNGNLSANNAALLTSTISTSLTLLGTLRDGLNAVGANNQVLSSNVTGVRWVNLPVYSAASPLLYNSGTGVFSIQQANASQGGYLSAADWITFDGKQTAISLTTTGNSGPSTLIGSTINVPNYTLAGLNGVPQTRTLTINGITYNLSADRSWTISAGVSSVTATTPLFSTGGATPVISIQQADSSSDGYLSSVDWLTFNNKQDFLGGTGLVKSVGGVISYITDNSSNWNTAYNDSIVSAAVTGTVTKTLTLNQQDGGTITASWSDIDTGLTSVGVSMPTAFTVTNSPLTSNGTIAITGSGNTLQYIDGTGALQTFPSLTGYVPYTGATQNVNLGIYSLTASSLIKNGGTSAQFLKADGSVDSNAYIVLGSLSASAPLSYNNTTGAFSINQAGAATDGYLSSTDWATFNSKQPAGNYITSLTGEATASGPGAAAVTLDNAAVIGKVLTGLNVTGGTVLAADSILIGFGKVQNQINGLIGGTIFQGTWNANTNTPALVSSVGTNGHYYIVSVAGTTNLDGITDWQVGDWAIFAGTTWEKVDNTDSVSSVNGFTGAVSLTTDNIPEGATNLYFTNTRARTAISLTTTGSSGASTYDNTTGVFNIPNYTDQFVGTVTSVGLSSVTSGVTIGSTPITTSGTITIAIATATASQNGLLSSADWATFNGKQNAITLTTTGTSGVSTLVGSTLNIPNYTTNLTGYVPYTGATTNVDLGDFVLTSGGLNVDSLGGNGGALNLRQATSFSTWSGAPFTSIYATTGNKVVFSFSNDNRTFTLDGSIVSAASPRTFTFPDASGTIALVGGAGVGTVTSVSFSLGSSGTDLSASVANSTTTPAITLNVPTASASARGALSAADWTTFNSKQPAGNYVTLDTTQTITALKTILRSGDVLDFKIGVDTLYGLKIAYNQNELVPSGEATWSFVNTFNRDGTGFSVTPISFFRGVLVTGERLLSVSVNANLLDYYTNNPSGRYPIYAYNTGVQQFASSIIVGETTGVVNPATGAIADLPAGVVANFKGRVIGSNAVNNNEFATLGQVTSGSRAAISLTTTGTSGPATYSSITGVLNIPEYQGGVTSFNTRTGAVTLTSSDVTTALGYTPVTDARTLTINGVTYDLTANRTWTVGVNPSAREIETFIATSGQTVFTVTGGYTVGLVDVFINGVRLTSSDYTATNGTTVVLTVGTMVGNIVDIIKYTSGFTNAVSGTGTTNTLPKFTSSTTIGNSLFTDDGTNGAFGGANYSSGTSVRTFNISAPLYPGIGFFANNVYTGDIFSYTVSGNLVVSADSTNILTDSRVILATDGTHRFSVFSDGNVTIANSPTNSGFKLDVAGTGRFISSGGYFSIDSNGQVTSTQSLDVATAGGRFTGMSSRGALGAIHIEQTTTGVNGGYITFRTSNSGSTTPTEKVHITSAGNVGIGVVPSAWATPTVGKVIQLGDRAALFSYNNQTIDLSTNLYFDGSDYRYLQSAFATLLRSNSTDGSFTFFSAASGTAGNTVPLTPRLTIDSTGAATFSSSVTTGSTLQANGNAFILPTLTGGGAGGGLYLGVYPDTQYTKQAILVERYVSVSGNYGRGSLHFCNRDTADANQPTLADSRMVITSGGNVGINTSSPVTYGTRNLEVNGGAGAAYIVARGSNNAGIIEMAFDGDGYIGTKTAHNLVIRTNDVQRINIFATSGNVLIGTGSDNGNKFQVIGSGSFSGGVSASGVSGFSVTATGAGANGISDGPFHRYVNTTNSYQILKQINANTDEDTWAYRGVSWSKIGNLNAVTGAYTPLSDRNKKKDFEESTIGLNAILGLKPTLYRMLDEDESVKKQLGFIAQEVKDYIPQAYVEQDNFIGLQDRPIVAALVKAVQELKAELDELKSKN